MDAKDLRTDSAVGARNDGSNKYGPGSITCDGNKPYQEVGSNSLGKVDIQTSRPCAVIGPDRVVAPVAPDVYHKKPPDQWLHQDQPYRRPPDYPLKMTDFQSPTRNISPRQTFQENMQRIMVPPTYNSMKLNSDSALSDTNVPISKNKLNVSTDAKYCEVPYNISPLTGEPKSYKNVDISVSVGNSTVNQSAPYLWSATSVQQSRPYGATEFYPYADYPGCGSVRTLPTSRPTHRLLPEETSSPYPERYFADGNVRFKPYPTIKDGYPQQRYECMSNYSNSYHPPPYPPPRYDIQKPVVPHMYSSYPQVPVKYIDNRMAEPAVDGFQRSNPPPNYSVAFHNQFIHPAYGPVPGNCVQNKIFSYPPDVSVKQNHMSKLAYENNKVYSDFDIRNKAYGIPDHYYGNDMIRAHSTKGQVMLSKHPPPNSAMGGHSYYRNPQFRNYDHNTHLKNSDYSLNMNSPIMRFTPHFSPNPSSMSPLESSGLHGIHDENIYLGQKPIGSMRNADLRRMKADMYGRYSTGLHRNYVDHKGTNSSKDKKNIDVRQFLQQWNDDDENHEANSSKQENVQNSIEQHQTSQNNKNQDQLYVLGLVNVPSEELSKYEHIQQISKLPDNIKGYNSLELLNQFEEAIEISNLNSNSNTSGKLCELQVPMKQLPVQRATIPPQPRPVSPLDVEAKISQSVIHKEVGCNFEIKPCSPKMLNVEVAAPVQTVLDERVIEKLANPHSIESPISKTSNNIISFSIPKNENNQANLLHTKNPSCKLTNQFNSNECIPTSKANYSLNDLEGSSGVCLASLPRLDNEIEFNFPEVNQQFIDANKPDSLITSASFVDAKSDLDYQQSLETGTHLKDTTLSTHFNAVVDPISYPKLSKYRKIKKIDSDSQNEVHFPVQAMRTDSVIIKNETAKESNSNTGYEKLLDNTSSSKYDEIRKPASSQTVFTESDRYEEKEKLIERLLEKPESSEDIIIDFSVHKNNSSLTNSNNETNNHHFDDGICDQGSAQKSSDISGHKTLDSLISDIYDHHAPDKVYNDVMQPANSDNGNNELNPLITENISETNTILSEPIKPEVEDNDDNETDQENVTDMEKTCLKENDGNEKVGLIQLCLNNEVEVVKIGDEHAFNTLSKIHSIDENKTFLKPDNKPMSIIKNNPNTSNSQHNLNWCRNESRLEDMKVNIDPFGILINSKESLNYHGESMNVDEVPLRTCAIIKVDKEIYKVDQHNNKVKFKDHSCESEDPNKEHTVFNIAENTLEERGECNEKTNTVELIENCKVSSVAEDNCAEIVATYSDLDSNNADLSKSAINHAVFENTGKEKISIAISNANVAIKDYTYGIAETVVKASGYVGISNSNTNGNTTDGNNTVSKDDIVKNVCDEVGEPHSYMNLNVQQLNPSNTIKDVTCLSNNNIIDNCTNISKKYSNEDIDKNIHATTFSEFDGNTPAGQHIYEEEVGVFKCDINLDTTDLHSKECSKSEYTSNEICVYDSNKTLAQTMGKHCASLENKQGVELNYSLINQNTTIPIISKNQEITQDEYTNKSCDESIITKTDTYKVCHNILFKDSNEESVSKLGPQLHNDSFQSPNDQVTEVTSFDNAMPLVTDLSHNEFRQKNSCLDVKSIPVDNSQDTTPNTDTAADTAPNNQVADVTSSDNAMPLVKDYSNNEFRHENSSFDVMSITVDNSQDTAPNTDTAADTGPNTNTAADTAPNNQVTDVTSFDNAMPLVKDLSHNEFRHQNSCLDSKSITVDNSQDRAPNNQVADVTSFDNAMPLVKDLSHNEFRHQNSCLDSKSLTVDNSQDRAPNNQVADVTRFDNAMLLVKDCSHNEFRHQNSCLDSKSITVDNSQDRTPNNQVADVTSFDNAMPLVKDCSHNEFRHQNCCLDSKSITVDNSQDRAPNTDTAPNNQVADVTSFDKTMPLVKDCSHNEFRRDNINVDNSQDTVSSKTNDYYNMVQDYRYEKICYNSVPIKQFSPLIQKLILHHEGIISLIPSYNLNNEMENIRETISNKSPSTCGISPNNLGKNIESESENSEKYKTCDHVKHEKQPCLLAVSTLKEIAAKVLQTKCDSKTAENNCCLDYNTKAYENSISNNCLTSKEVVSTKYTTKTRSSLKRSLSDSALNIFEDRSVTADHLWPKRRKPTKESIQTNLLAENYCRLLQNHRRNSIATIFNEDISFCILLDDNCIITEESEDMTRNDLEEAISDSDHEELFNDHLKDMEKVNQDEDVDVEIEEKPNEDCWIEDVACMETVVSDYIEESEEGVDYTEEENYLNIDSTLNHDAISKLDHKKVSAINVTNTFQNINEVRYETDSLDNSLFKASQMDVSNIISKEDVDRQTLENILTGTDSVKIITNGYDVLKTSTHPCLENDKGPDIFFDTEKECHEKPEMDSLQKTQYDIIHSCESSIDNVFSYQDKEDITRYSTSPEVSSTTSEDKCSSILLKITNYKGSIISELSNSNDTKRISCKYTENNDYNKSNNKNCSNRPLITKAAQKYIPPLSESIPDLKVKLPLPPQSLLKFKDLKMAKEFPKVDSKLHKRSNIEPNVPKKLKPKFEDVLKSIDEIQIKMHKEKSKRIKKCIPKVVIKKSENGSHYTSSQNNQLSDPDLTGRKWQPWVFIERSTLIDKMASKNKTKAIFSHRKNEFVLKDSFRKYKSVSSAKFVITQPRAEKLSKGQLKYTIKLKHSY